MEITLDFIQSRPLSYSSLKEFKKSPAHYIHYLTNKKPASAAQATGNLIDKAILTPDEFEERVVAMPKYDFRKPADKKAYADFCALNEGKILATQEDIDEAKLIRDKMYSNQKSMLVLSQITKTQDKITWKDKATGLLLNGYRDAIGDTITIELKSTKDASPTGFMRECLNYDYPLQAACYMEADKVKRYHFPDFYYLAVEKTAPYGIGVYRASKEYLEYGQELYRKLLDKFKYCMENNLWHCTYEFHNLNHDYLPLELPSYLKFKRQD